MVEFTLVGILALAYVGMGLPLALRKVKRNYSYGFRLPKHAMNDDEIWYLVNELGGKHMVVTGIILFVLAVLLLVFQGKLMVVKPVLLLTLVVSMGGILFTWAKCKALTNSLADSKGLKRKK